MAKRVFSREPDVTPIQPHTYATFAVSLLDPWMTSPGSLLTSRFSLLASRFSLLASRFSLLTSHFSLLTSSTDLVPPTGGPLRARRE